jgi:hypothetical protein
MTSQGTASGRFTRAIRARNLLNAEIAAREMGELPLGYALEFCLLLADSSRHGGDERSPGGTRGSCLRRPG